jgi:hypothetical protein
METKSYRFLFGDCLKIFHTVLKLQKEMSCQVELIPISEGNRITIKENEKLIVGRGSSLGVC